MLCCVCGVCGVLVGEGVRKGGEKGGRGSGWVSVCGCVSLLLLVGGRMVWCDVACL